MPTQIADMRCLWSEAFGLRNAPFQLRSKVRIAVPTERVDGKTKLPKKSTKLYRPGISNLYDLFLVPLCNYTGSLKKGAGMFPCKTTSSVAQRPDGKVWLARFGRAPCANHWNELRGPPTIVVPRQNMREADPQKPKRFLHMTRLPERADTVARTRRPLGIARWFLNWPGLVSCRALRSNLFLTLIRAGL